MPANDSTSSNAPRPHDIHPNVTLRKPRKAVADKVPSTSVEADLARFARLGISENPSSRTPPPPQPAERSPLPSPISEAERDFAPSVKASLSGLTIPDNLPTRTLQPTQRSPSPSPISDPESPKAASTFHKVKVGPRLSVAQLSEGAQEQLLKSFDTISQSDSEFADDLRDLAREKSKVLSAYTDAVRQTRSTTKALAEPRIVDVFRLSSLKEEHLKRLNVKVTQIEANDFNNRVIIALQKCPQFSAIEEWWVKNKDPALITFQFLYKHWSTSKESGCRTLIDPMFVMVFSMLQSSGIGYPVMIPEVALTGKDGKPFRIVHEKWTTFLSGVVDYLSLNFMGSTANKSNDNDKTVSQMQSLMSQRKLTNIPAESRKVLNALTLNVDNKWKATTQFAEAKSTTVKDLQTAIPQAIGESLIILDHIKAKIVPFTVTNWFGWRFGATVNTNSGTSTFTSAEVVLDPKSGDAEFTKQIRQVYLTLAYFAIANKDQLLEVFK